MLDTFLSLIAPVTVVKPLNSSKMRSVNESYFAPVAEKGDMSKRT